jgi:chromate reductase, NAD(P)H dehydrogenase (quinone)
MPLRVLAISGSLRRGSYSTGILRAAKEDAPAGIAVEFYDGLDRIPAFNQDLEHDPPEPVRELDALIEDADALLIATPEYNGSIPGALKNALDWVSRPHGEAALTGEPVAVIGSSPTPFGAAWAQEHLRRALALSGAVVLEDELKIGRVDERFRDGELADRGTREEIAAVLSNLAELATAAALAAEAA